MSAKRRQEQLRLRLDYARAAPGQVQKYGRAMVVMISVKEFQRLSKPSEGIGKGAKASS
jgi:hypothetical protein